MVRSRPTSFRGRRQIQITVHLNPPAPFALHIRARSQLILVSYSIRVSSPALDLSDQPAHVPDPTCQVSTLGPTQPPCRYKRCPSSAQDFPCPKHAPLLNSFTPLNPAAGPPCLPKKTFRNLVPPIPPDAQTLRPGVIAAGWLARMHVCSMFPRTRESHRDTARNRPRRITAIIPRIPSLLYMP